LYSAIRPLIFSLDPETAHNVVHGVLVGVQKIPPLCSLVEKFYSYPSSRFVQKLWGIEFRNPLGLAAGFDKNARVCDSMAALGFGFLELGSVTNERSEGNPKPRLFRLPEDRALINRMGLNNHGPYQFLSNYNSARTGIPKFVNIAKTNNPAVVGDDAVMDMLNCYKAVGEFAHVVVFNLSCPNTEDGRTFEDPELMKNLLDRVMSLRDEKSYTHPVLLKFSNDVPFDTLEKLVQVSLASGVSGFVIGNTSVQRTDLKSSPEVLEKTGKGGLSGAPVFQRALERVRFVYSVSEGRVPVVGVGGVETGEQALQMFKAGASLIELYTALVYRGPYVVHSILEDVERYLVKNSILTLREIVGTAS
jgi:dihydroorotate dehydrogenase